MAKANGDNLKFDIGDAKKHLVKIREYCLEKKYTIATAESVTSGLLQAMLSQAKDAQSFYQGGITVYNSGQKTRHLDIEPIHAMDCNGVSEEVTTQLALNVSKKFCSQIGIGITGYASPVPEEGILDLYAFMAIAKNGAIMVSKRFSTSRTEPAEVQLEFAYNTIKTLATVLK